MELLESETDREVGRKRERETDTEREERERERERETERGDGGGGREIGERERKEREERERDFLFFDIALAHRQQFSLSYWGFGKGARVVWWEGREYHNPIFGLTWVGFEPLFSMPAASPSLTY